MSPLPAPGTNDVYTKALRTQSLGETNLGTISTSTALSTDVGVGGPDYYVVLVSTGAISSWVLTNGVQGQRIGLQIYRAGTQTVNFPTNFRWGNNTPPVLGPAGTWNFFEMRYNSSNQLWSPASPPVLGVPNS